MFSYQKCFLKLDYFAINSSMMKEANIYFKSKTKNKYLYGWEQKEFSVNQTQNSCK